MVKIKYKIVLSDINNEILEERIVDTLSDVYYFMKEHVNIYNLNFIHWVINPIIERND